MQKSQTIVAVNTDPDAPIFGYADLGAVADVHEVVEHLQALI
jgi:electron transfer flavoprotein alpha subunit